MRPSQIITDYRLSHTRSISADEMFDVCVEWTGDHQVKSSQVAFNSM